MRTPRLRCGRCGKFIAEPADSYTPYGSVYDDEPETVFLCEKCVQEKIAIARKNKALINHWIPAKYQYELAKEFGLVRVDGWWQYKGDYK